MEDTLRVVSWKWLLQTVASLNPCFNGRYSQMKYQNCLYRLVCRCLNPCFNGRYSQSQRLHCNEQRGEVLILVLMEDTLRVRDELR